MSIGRLVQRRERGDADQRTLEFADVALDAAGDELEDVAGHVEPIHLRLLAQNRDAGLEFGRLNVGDQAPLEPGAQPVLERRQLLGRPVGGDDDLLVRVVQRVEGVEELLLDAFLALDELDVVDQQHVDVAVAALERRLAVVAQRVDEVVGELFGRDVLDPHPGKEALGVVAGGVQQVRLAEAGLTPDEERVVGAGRRLGDGQRRGVREPVGRADDERVERVAAVEVDGGGVADAAFCGSARRSSVGQLSSALASASWSSSTSRRARSMAAVPEPVDAVHRVVVGSGRRCGRRARRAVRADG